MRSGGTLALTWPGMEATNVGIGHPVSQDERGRASCIRSYASTGQLSADVAHRVPGVVREQDDSVAHRVPQAMGVGDGRAFREGGMLVSAVALAFAEIELRSTGDGLHVDVTVERVGVARTVR